MKLYKNNRIHLLFLLVFVGLQNILFAQDTSYTSTTTLESESLWYSQPWIWILGALVLLLLLFSLFSRSSKNKNVRTDQIIINKTVTSEPEQKI
ncbi:MAG: hypothetical protein WKF35_09650 [Ferruginibacter sp.]